MVGSAGSVMPASSVRSDLDAGLVAAGLTGFQSSMSNGTGFKFLLGYEVSPNLALEAGYLDMGTMTYGISKAGTNVNVDVKPTGANVALLGVWPISDKFSAFGKIGYTSAKITASSAVSGSSFSVSDNSSSAGYGVGATYKLGENLKLRAEWEQLYKDMSMVSVGLQYTF